jgi:ABC-type multidrug transport system fused ATPase/permease subunit
MPPQLKDRILVARTEFRELFAREGQARLLFYEPDRYIESRSIRDNILFGQPKPGRPGVTERIGECLVQLLIEEGVLETILELGLDFQVGSMGEYLSSGQRQKIALARVFLKEPAVYILDEATSAWTTPPRPGSRISCGPCAAGHTVISVVHRLDTVSHYDRIVVMKAGKIVESGPFAELMAAKGVLHDLVGSA